MLHDQMERAKFLFKDFMSNLNEINTSSNPIGFPQTTKMDLRP